HGRSRRAGGHVRARGAAARRQLHRRGARFLAGELRDDRSQGAGPHEPGRDARGRAADGRRHRSRRRRRRPDRGRAGAAGHAGAPERQRALPYAQQLDAHAARTSDAPPPPNRRRCRGVVPRPEDPSTRSGGQPSQRRAGICGPSGRIETTHGRPAPTVAVRGTRARGPESARRRPNPSPQGSPAMKLHNRVVVITGAAAGIGRASARRFAQRGAILHLIDLDGARLEAVAVECARLGARACFHVADCRDAAAQKRVAAEVLARDAVVDVLFLNAGVGYGGNIAEMTLEDWRLVLDTNLLGVVHGLDAFLRPMLEQGTGGHILITASMLGLYALPRAGAYAASKHALVGLSQSLRAEVRARGI